MNKKIQDFLSDLQLRSKNHYDIVIAVRKLFLESNSDLTEEIKYGGLLFGSNKKLVGGIFSYSKHISIEFSEGASFNDPYSLLEGKGKYRRHIKLESVEDIEIKKVATYIEQCLKT